MLIIYSKKYKLKKKKKNINKLKFKIILKRLIENI